MVNKRSKEYRDKRAAKRAMKEARKKANQMSKEERETEINKVKVQLLTIGFATDDENIVKFIKICDEFIEHGEYIDGKIPLEGYKREIQYRFSNNRTHQIFVNLAYNPKV